MINIKLKNTADTPAGKDPNSYSPTLKNNIQNQRNHFQNDCQERDKNLATTNGLSNEKSMTKLFWYCHTNVFVSLG